MTPKGSELVAALDRLVEEHHLLKHPFYQAWSEGRLSAEALKLYAAQYYKHVEAFPQHLLQLMDRCEGEIHELARENFKEELNPAAPHPELWRDFAHAVGVSDDEIDEAEPLEGIKTLISTYDEITRQRSIAAAVAAFYAYESQVPEIASEKIKGLKAHYGVDSWKGLGYFAVHQVADEQHREQWRGWLEAQSDIDADEVLAAAEAGLKALWGALDACNIDPPTCH